MVDTVAIADLDSDPNLTDQEFFDILAVMTEDTTPERKITFVMIAKEASATVAACLQDALEYCCGLAIEHEDYQPAWVMSALEGAGIDINNSQTQAAVNALIDIGQFSSEMASATIAMGTVTELVFPRLILQHVTDARMKRAAGDI